MTATHGEGAYGNAAGVTTPTEHKMAQVAEFVKTTTANVIRPGVLYNGSTSLVTGKANMSYDVSAFTIVTQRSATSGAMKWGNDGTYNVATTAAPGSNSRIDTVYAWHREYAIDGTNSDPVIAVAQGTAAAVPSAPSLAGFPGAIELARIVVPAGVTATNSGTTFTHVSPFTSVDGGNVSFRNTTEMNLWTTALADQRALDLSSGITYRWSGSAWAAWESDWITWSTAPTNFTVGTGGSVLSLQRYRYVSGRVLFWCHYILGTTSFSVTGQPTLNLPINLQQPVARNAQLVGEGSIYDVSTGATVYYVKPRLNGTAANQIAVSLYTGTYAAISAGTPMTWAAGDEMALEFWGDPA